MSLKSHLDFCYVDYTCLCNFLILYIFSISPLCSVSYWCFTACSFETCHLSFYRTFWYNIVISIYKLQNKLFVCQWFDFLFFHSVFQQFNYKLEIYQHLISLVEINWRWNPATVPLYCPFWMISNESKCICYLELDIPQ